ncbi:MAG: FAD binding domain-containing protein, partial [Zestosphaera sp.]
MFRFDVYVPRDLRDALEASKIYGEELLPIGGGTDLLVLYRQGLVKFRILLDLWPLRNELSYVKLEGGSVKIGALTTINELESSELLKDKRFAGLRDACRGFASPFIKSVATVGGNVGAAHPLSDIAITLLTYDANVRLKSLEGERVIPLKSF